MDEEIQRDPSEGQDRRLSRPEHIVSNLLKIASSRDVDNHVLTYHLLIHVFYFHFMLNWFTAK